MIWLLACTSKAEPQLQVVAASSLVEAFTAIRHDFEQAHGLSVATTFAGSQILATQVRQGMPAHTFASANERHLQELHEEGLARVPRPLARNRLVLAVPESSPLHSFEQLSTCERLVVGTPELPAGAYADELLQNAAAHYSDWSAPPIVSRETNVRYVRAKLSMGEADCALIYASDLNAQPELRGIHPPEAIAPEVLVFHAAMSPEATPWMAFVEDQGRAVLHEHGLEPL